MGEEVEELDCLCNVLVEHMWVCLCLYSVGVPGSIKCGGARVYIVWVCLGLYSSGVGNAAAAAALAAAPFKPRLCGRTSSEPYNSAAVGKGSTTPVIE